jgi:hypothetical protein
MDQQTEAKQWHMYFPTSVCNMSHLGTRFSIADQA